MAYKRRKVWFEGEDLSDPTGVGEPHLLRTYDPDEIKRWVKWRCRASGLSPSMLAKKAGLSSSTITKYLADPNPKKRLSTGTLQMLDSASDYEMTQISRIAHGQPRLGSESVYTIHDYEDIDVSDNDPVDLFSRHKTEHDLPVTLIVGRAGFNSLDDWSYGWEYKEADKYVSTFLVTPGFSQDPTFGLDIIGQDMNQVFPPGAVVFCQGWEHVDIDPVPGWYVVVVRRRKADDAYQRVVRQVSVEGPGEFWLWPRSDRPALQEPWRYDPDDDGGYEVRITALVVSSLKYEVVLTESFIAESEKRGEQ